MITLLEAAVLRVGLPQYDHVDCEFSESELLVAEACVARGLAEWLVSKDDDAWMGLHLTEAGQRDLFEFDDWWTARLRGEPLPSAESTESPPADPPPATEAEGDPK